MGLGCTLYTFLKVGTRTFPAFPASPAFIFHRSREVYPLNVGKRIVATQIKLVISSAFNRLHGLPCGAGIWTQLYCRLIRSWASFIGALKGKVRVAMRGNEWQWPLASHECKDNRWSFESKLLLNSFWCLRTDGFVNYTLTPQLHPFINASTP